MSSSRLLDFFVLEASDYIDRLDALLSASDGQPDAASLTAQARLLRGSATMARQSPVSDLASALERIGRAVRDDIIVWSPELHSALIAAVDDLRILVRAVRSWGPGDDRRTESRISELVSLYPQATKSHPTPPTTLRNSSFIASESAQLATALDTLVAHPSAIEALAVAVHRLNSLRGVAAINDTPPLAQVLTSLDDILRPLHLREALPETQHLAVLTSAVQLLRRFSQEIAIGGMLDSNSALVHDFNAALSGLGRQPASDPEAIVPIAHLNFEDGQPQLVSTPRQPDALPPAATRSVTQPPSYVYAAAPAAPAEPAPVAPRAATPAQAPAPVRAAPPPPVIEPPAPVVFRGPMSGAGLSELLSAGISGLSALEAQPLSEPVPVEEEAIVPIEQLLYRGREAISRALEIRDGIRARAGAPQTEELDELFELLDLAVTE